MAPATRGPAPMPRWDEPGAGARAPDRRAQFSWALFDFAAQPYYTLILTFIFAPYFVSELASSPARGQANWGYLQAVIAIVVAVVAPFIGARLDRARRLGGFIAAWSAAYVAGLLALWYAAGASGLLVAVLAVGIAGVSVELTTLATNALMPRLAAAGGMGRLSGSAWALGYVGGILSLAIVLAVLAPAPGGGATLAGLPPLFGAGGAARATGPLSAVWYAVFVVPLFVWVLARPEYRAPPPRAGAAPPRQGLALLARLRERPDIARFLVARLVYQDGLGAVFTFGAAYGASLFGWGTAVLGMFGVWLAVTAAVGAFLGGRLDDRLGAKPVILGALVLALAGLVFIGFAAAPAAPGAPFASPGEQLYLAGATLFGLASGPMQASSRSYLVRRVPAEEIGSWFGLFAFSGKATAFAGPLLVGLATELTASQFWGLVPIGVLFILGFALFLRAPPDR